MIFLSWLPFFQVASSFAQSPDSALAQRYWQRFLDSYGQNPDTACYYGSLAGQWAKISGQYAQYVASLNALVGIYYLQGDLTQARILVDSAHKMAEQYLSPKEGVYRAALTNRASILQLEGQYVQAERTYQALLQADFIPTTSAELTDYGNLYQNLGSLYNDQFEYQRSIAFTRMGIRYLKEAAVQEIQLAIPYSSLGLAYQASPTPDSALWYYQAANRILAKYPTESNFARHLTVLGNISHAYLLDEQYDSALYYVSLGRPLFYQTQGSSATYFGQIGASVYTQLGQYDHAFSLLKEMENRRVREYGQEGNPFLLGRIQRRVGDVYLSQGKWQEAIAAYQISLQAYSLRQESAPDSTYRSFLPERAARLWTRLAQAQWAQQGPHAFEQAKTSFDLALRMQHESLYILESQGAQLGLLTELTYIHESYLEMLWEADSMCQTEQALATALQVAEIHKAQLLRLSIDKVKHKISAGVPADLLAQEKEIRRGLAATQEAVKRTQISSGDTGHLLDSLEITLLGEIQKLKQFMAGLESQYPAYVELRYMSQDQLKSDSGSLSRPLQPVFSVFWGKEYVYCFTFDTQNWKWFRVPTHQLTPIVEAVSQYVHNPTLSIDTARVFQATSHELYQSLHLNELPIDQEWQVILDGPLHFIPLESLSVDTKNITAWGDISYLGLVNPIRYQYTITSLPLPKHPLREHDGWFGVAPLYPGLEEMYFNQAEVTEIGQLLEAPFISGSPATRARFLDKTSQYEWVHFAGHARVNPTFPMQSKLEFSPDSVAQLFAWEIFNLDIQAEVMVLSGCETGGGEFWQGEGVLGLARAFRYAGVSNIIQSIWQADGQATHALMLIFYEQFQLHSKLSPALFHARSQFITDMPSRFHHPYYWANFVLLGPDVHPHSRFYLSDFGIWILLIFFGGGMVIYILLKQRCTKAWEQKVINRGPSR